MTIIIMAKITVAKLETILTLIFTPPAADHHCACTQFELIFIEPAALQTKTRGDFSQRGAHLPTSGQHHRYKSGENTFVSFQTLRTSYT